jgi:hypothetical protein
MAVGHPQDLMHVGLVDENDTLPDEAAPALALFDHAGTDRAACDDVLEAISVRLAAVAGGSTAALDQAAALATALVEEFGFIRDARFRTRIARKVPSSAS